VPEPGSAADVVRAWDARADHYLELFRHELDGKPFDREVLDAAGGPLDGIVSYYSLHDQPKSGLAGTLAAWASAIRPRGQLLVVVTEGVADGMIDDPLGSGIRVYWAEFSQAELVAAAQAAGFRVDDVTGREAYDDEIRTRRLFVSATRLTAGFHPERLNERPSLTPPRHP
jgi:hypothetical protein